MASFDWTRREPHPSWWTEKGPRPPGCFISCGCGGDTDCERHPWIRPYSRKRGQLKKFGLVTRLRLNINETGFVSLHTEILEDSFILPRHSDKWVKHISLGYIEDFPPQLLERLRRRWHCRVTRLQFIHMGGGGTGFISNCELADCPLFKMCKRRGYYNYSDPHISF
jgi:hypothetical protein